MPLFENLKKATQIENYYDNSSPKIKYHKEAEFENKYNITYPSSVCYNKYIESDTIILLKLFNLYKINQLNEQKFNDLLKKINNSESLKKFIELLKTLPIDIEMEISEIQNDEAQINDNAVIKINI